MTQINELLEKYIEGKDLDRHEILEQIYLPTAVVPFENNADNLAWYAFTKDWQKSRSPCHPQR